MRLLRLALAVATSIAALGLGSARAQPRYPEWSPEGHVPATEPPAAHLLFPPRPDLPTRLDWRHRRVHLAELYATGGLAVLAISSVAIGSRSDGWKGGVLFDDDVRSSARLGSYQSRRGARDASDVLLALSIANPILGDGVLTAYWHHQSPDVAEQILLINTETLALTFAVQATVTSLASRERPYGQDCGSELDPELRDCERNDRYRSFFSGHASGAFAAASLSCMHHLNVPLYGGGAPEVASCTAGYAVAAATAALRVVGDMHYASDVTVGAAWGTLAGLGVPWLLHSRLPVSAQRKAVAPSVHLVPHPTGLAIGGAF